MIEGGCAALRGELVLITHVLQQIAGLTVEFPAQRVQRREADCACLVRFQDRRLASVIPTRSARSCRKSGRRGRARRSEFPADYCGGDLPQSSGIGSDERLARADRANRFVQLADTPDRDEEQRHQERCVDKERVL